VILGCWAGSYSSSEALSAPCSQSNGHGLYGNPDSINSEYSLMIVVYLSSKAYLNMYPPLCLLHMIVPALYDYAQSFAYGNAAKGNTKHYRTNFCFNLVKSPPSTILAFAGTFSQMGGFGSRFCAGCMAPAMMKRMQKCRSCRPFASATSLAHPQLLEPCDALEAADCNSSK